MLRATLAFTLVATAAAVLTTLAGSLLVAEGPQLRAGIVSTAWWAALLGAVTAAVAARPLLPSSHAPASPLRRELSAALRGLRTGTTGLLSLAALTVLALGVREALIADGGGVVEGTAGGLLLLPTALVVTAGLALGVPLTVGSGGQQTASLGLTGIEGIGTAGASVPIWLWGAVVLATAVLVLAGAGATWRAAADGVRATRVGLAVGPLMVLLWLPLAILASATVELGGGAAELLTIIGLTGASGGGDIRIGLSLGLLTAVLLVLGSVAGWLGSLLAKGLWGRTPRWLLTATGGRPDAGWPA